MINLMEEALNELKIGGNAEKAAVYALLMIAQALQSLDAIAAHLEERSIHVKVESLD